MKEIWFEYWGGFIEVQIVTLLPDEGRYLCTDFDEEVDYYDVGESYIVAFSWKEV